MLSYSSGSGEEYTRSGMRMTRLRSITGGVTRPCEWVARRAVAVVGVDLSDPVGQYDVVLRSLLGLHLEHRTDHEIRRQPEGVRWAGLGDRRQLPRTGIRIALKRPSEIGDAFAVTGTPLPRRAPVAQVDGVPALVRQEPVPALEGRQTQ